MEIIWNVDSSIEMPMSDSPLFSDSLPSEQGLLTPQDWDLASIESTLSPAVFDQQDVGGIEFVDWLEMDQKTEKFWKWNSTTTYPNAYSNQSSCCSFFCCSADFVSSFEISKENSPMLAQTKWNQQIAAQMSPLQKFQDRLQGIHRRLSRQQRRKFSLKNGRDEGEKLAKNCRINAANRISLRKWREELKNVLKTELICMEENGTKKRRRMDKSQ